MSSCVSNLVHFVWGTEGRRAWNQDAWCERLYGYLGGVLKNKSAKPLAVGGMQDHMHVYASLPATVSLARIANALKANSTRWIRRSVPRLEKFSWQKGYGAFTVSKSLEPALIEYIRNQERHHSRQRFQEEFVALLERHGINYDERYLWV